MKKTVVMMVCLLTATIAFSDNHWVGTWGTAPQLVENNNNPPSPGLGNNSLRQIVQVSIGGEKVRLKLTNEARRLKPSNWLTPRQQAAAARLTSHRPSV